MIEVPAKVWRPKVICRYRTPDFLEDDTDGILDYSQYRSCFYRHNLSWIDKSSQQDIIVTCIKLNLIKIHPSITQLVPISKHLLPPSLRNTRIVSLKLEPLDLFSVMNLESIQEALNQYVARNRHTDLTNQK